MLSSKRVALEWARIINAKSPTAQRMLKFAFNLVDDGLMGQQVFAGEATRLAYMTDEAVEGRDAFLEKRRPDWSTVPLVLLTVRLLHGVAPADSYGGAPRRLRRSGTGAVAPTERARVRIVDRRSATRRPKGTSRT